MKRGVPAESAVSAVAIGASTLLPPISRPEVIDCDGKPFIFVDGGSRCTTTRPSDVSDGHRGLFRSGPEKRGWKTGVDEMLIVSVGTGTSAGEITVLSRTR
jgi:hypothetical protein